MANGDHLYNVTATIMMPGSEPTIRKGTVAATDTLELDSLRREMKRTRCLSVNMGDGSIVEIQGVVYDHAVIQFTPHKLSKKEREAEQHGPPEHESQVALGAVNHAEERGNMAGASKIPERRQVRKPIRKRPGPSAESNTSAISRFNQSNHMDHRSRRAASH